LSLVQGVPLLAASLAPHVPCLNAERGGFGGSAQVVLRLAILAIANVPVVPRPHSVARRRLLCIHGAPAAKGDTHTRKKEGERGPIAWHSVGTGAAMSRQQTASAGHSHEPYPRISEQSTRPSWSGSKTLYVIARHRAGWGAGAWGRDTHVSAHAIIHVVGVV